jgi:4-diphosphocytidyl-2-C-methyl-D-erythritol kinase
MGGADRGRPLRIDARAKVNLGLEVLRKRTDGYHEIRTLVQTIRLSDRLELRPGPRDTLDLRCPGSDLPADERNLVLRAAQLLRERTGSRAGCRIILHKRIPVGAGLGGGSSDAAATLGGLNRVWGLRLRPAELEVLGAELGSDVPFFVRGGTQLARGRGEVLTRIAPPPRLPVMVVFPNVFVSTSSVYSDPTIRLTPIGPLARLPDCDLATRSGFMSCVARLRNDLEGVVVRRSPEVEQILAGLRSQPGVIARVTGSGSAIFALAERTSHLRRALQGVAGRPCQVFWTTFAQRGWVAVVPRGAGKRHLS